MFPRHGRHSCVEKVLDVNSSFTQDAAQCSLAHVTRMMRHQDDQPAIRVTPYLVRPLSLAIIGESKGTQLADDFLVLKSAQTTHQRTPTGIFRSIGPSISSAANVGGSGSPWS